MPLCIEIIIKDVHYTEVHIAGIAFGRAGADDSGGRDIKCDNAVLNARQSVTGRF